MQRILDEGLCGTIEELAKREKVNRGYLSRVLRLTLLAPEVIEAILDGGQPDGIRMDDLLEEFPVEWESQKKELVLLPGPLLPGTRMTVGPGSGTRILEPSVPRRSESLCVLSVKGSMAELRTRPLYSYRDDPAVSHFDDRGPIAIMDGECALCAGGARAIARFGRKRHFRIGRT